MLRSLLRVGNRHWTCGSRILPKLGQCPPPSSHVILKRYFGFSNRDDVECAGTMEEVHRETMRRLGLEIGYEPLRKSREHLLKYEPKLEDLPSRSMKDSFTSAIIPLKTDKPLQNKYVSVLGRVRMGRLMEDMDSFAVWVCHKHMFIPNLPENVALPYTFVTVLVDKVTLSDFATKANEDIRLTGHATWVGRSSIEIVVWLEQERDGKYEMITKALFLMAARNAVNTASAPFNPMIPANEEEERIFKGGEMRKKRRQQSQASSVLKVEPNAYEQSLMYDIHRRTTHTDVMELNKRILPANCRWMSESYKESLVTSFPEHRNAQYSVFGGFIMRIALETTFSAAFLYCKSRPKLIHISDITFERPVSVSSFIKIKSYVVYTRANYVQLMTVADILEAASGEQFTSNVFYFTYMCQENVPEVLPRTYHETMWYLQGRRKFNYVMELET